MGNQGIKRDQERREDKRPEAQEEATSELKSAVNRARRVNTLIMLNLHFLQTTLF